LSKGFPPELKRRREAGCWFAGPGREDHEIWYGPITKLKFPIDAKILSCHTADGVLDRAGLPKAF
jgi:hypothetical protein